MSTTIMLLILTHHTGTPTFSELQKFKCADRKQISIPEEIGTKYVSFGSLLLPQDSTGTRVKNMAHQFQNDPERINEEILRQWLSGKGKQPVTWATLTEVLHDIGLSTLAKDISAVKC